MGLSLFYGGRIESVNYDGGFRQAPPVLGGSVA